MSCGGWVGVHMVENGKGPTQLPDDLRLAPPSVLLLLLLTGAP